MLLVLVMVIGMIPFSALSASAIGLADYYKTIKIGNDVYDVATMPGNPSGEGYSITSTGPASLVINLNNYNGGPIEVDTTNDIYTDINVYGDCVINAPSGYAIKFASDFSDKMVTIKIADDSSLTITGKGGIYLLGDTNSKLIINGGVTSKLNINATDAEALHSTATRGLGSIHMNGDFNATIESPYSITCDTVNAGSAGLIPMLYIGYSDYPNFNFIKSDTAGDYAIPNVGNWRVYQEYSKLSCVIDGDSVLIQKNRTLTANGDAAIYVDGSAKGSTATVAPCTTVKLVAPEIAGKYFTGWEFSREDVPFTEEEKKQSELTFDMPNCDLTATATYINLDIGFASLTPTPDMDEADWDELASDLGTMALGSADTNITFNFSAKTLSTEAIAAGYSVKRALKVTRDGITIYDKEYEANEVYGWNLKDNIDEGGNYHIIPQLNYYLDGVKIAEVSHLYTVKVTGSTIKTISLAGIGTPVIGKAPSSVEFAFSNTDGVIIKKVQWEYYSSEMGGGFVNMPDGSVFEEGKRYAVLLELETADGYSFAANKEDMTVYINGQKANLTYNYTNNEFGVELEMTPITDPAFTTLPVGGMVAEGEKFTITWETNFKPAWIEIYSFNSANGAPNKAIEVPADATSFELDANEFGYVLNVYYNGNQCVSNGEKFYVNEIKRISEINVTVTQPKAGETPADATTTESGYTISTQWWVLEEDGQYRPFEGNFEAGKQYAVYTFIEVKAGYEFIAKPTFKVNGSSNTIRIGSTDSYYTGVYEFFTINSIELQVAKPVIGEAPTKPTIKSVNGDESLKDKIKFYSDSKVYWVEADSSDLTNYTKNPTVFADGKIYALHYAIQSIDATIAENCVVYIYDTDGTLLYSGGVTFSDPADNTLVYADAVLGNFKLEIGNVNGDDLIDFTDLQRLYQHITGDSPLSGDALGAADVNADTVIDFSDLQALFALLSQNA